MRRPTRGWSRSAILRLHACTEAIALAMSTKRTKNFGSTEVSTRVKRSLSLAVSLDPPPQASHAIRFPWRWGCVSASWLPQADRRRQWIRCVAAGQAVGNLQTLSSSA